MKLVFWATVVCPLFTLFLFCIVASSDVNTFPMWRDAYPQKAPAHGHGNAPHGSQPHDAAPAGH